MVYGTYITGLLAVFMFIGNFLYFSVVYIYPHPVKLGIVMTASSSKQAPVTTLNSAMKGTWKTTFRHSNGCKI